MKFLKADQTLKKMGSLVLLLGFHCLYAQQYPDITKDKSGKVELTKDSVGNQIPDFSYAGYEASAKAIPIVPVKVVVPTVNGDATELIQKAIDYVGSLKPDANGFRGTVLLNSGTYTISGTLYFKVSGVVLRGSGSAGDNGTRLLGTGIKREAMISVLGQADVIDDQDYEVNQSFTPLGTLKIQLNQVNEISVGNEIVITKQLTKEWIGALSMNEFGGETGWLGWKVGDWNISWNRIVTSIEDNKITLDAPLTMALDNAFGTTSVQLVKSSGKLTNIGIENLKMDSEFDTTNLKDELHRWQAISMNHVKNAWVRQVNFEHFAGGAVSLLRNTQQITVEDCMATNPVSEIAAFRRLTFYTEGQQTLFQRCYSEFGYNDFAVGGFGTTGPNVFVQCESHLPYSNSGAIGSWATGVLFDIAYVDGEALSYNNREQDGRGAGWTTANSVLWESSASKIKCYSPPTATNWTFGVWGQFAGNGIWKDVNSHINPRSLFYALLENRLDSLPMKPYLKDIGSEPSSSPTLEQAAELTQEAVTTLKSLPQWISDVKKMNPITTETNNAKLITEIKFKEAKAKQSIMSPIKHNHGILTQNGNMIMGNTMTVMWWRGSLRYDDVFKASPHVTRFVPGRRGKGLTDNINETVQYLQDDNIVALDHNYGLWYDRRMDDHERVRRIDADVWPPFYEQPFGRSGEGLAWDHLSKYDLTKYNTWYWTRLDTYADLAEEAGQLLLHEQYFQHNILEAGAHWSSSPWRSANNINASDFPEPPPYAGDKRIFMAEQFYDISNENRRNLHEKFIWHALETFKGNSNVVQLTSAEYTGPLHFMQFWLDVAKQYETETGDDQLIGLSATKDVQDAILKDKIRAATVDVIDIRYWYYKEDGSLYAPGGGKNLAPRQHARKMDTGKETEKQVYHAVREYVENYNKVVLYNTNRAPSFGWAVLMAKGSLPNIPKVDVSTFAAAIPEMDFEANTSYLDNVWKLQHPGNDYLFYVAEGDLVTVDLSDYKGRYEVYYINAKTGKVSQEERIKGGKIITLNTKEKVIFIHKK